MVNLLNMNTWEVRKVAIIEADDFSDVWDRNGLNFIFYWKAKFPKFKISLFTIPDKTTSEMLSLISKHSDFIELCVHGWRHESNFECYGWDYDKTKILMMRLATTTYKPIFKAPGWSIYPGNNGYPSAPEDPITKDPTAVYRALKDLDFIVVDRHYNKPARPEGLKVICIDCNPDIVHMHTWNMMTPNPDERNGFEQVEIRGVPWNENTSFFTIGDAWKEGLIKPCQD